ncbi:MAG TPA: aromatic-ring-hydroxylating dioxygenase subunit beta [Xanthobacteraceae bacterium]|nr:aromatic-ring-hydroxylating dioxygenase subunit beta [Xanthobacteraceae bacterium]
MAPLDRDLVLRMRIEALYAEYAQAIDDDRLESWPEFFAEDGKYRVTTRENYGSGLALAMMYCDGRGMMSDRISALRLANIYEPHVYCHLTSCVRVVEPAPEIRAQANFAVIRTMQEGDQSIFACGRTYDRMVEVDGRLKFKDRLVVLDSRQVDTLLVIPI